MDEAHRADLEPLIEHQVHAEAGDGCRHQPLDNPAQANGTMQPQRRGQRRSGVGCRGLHRHGVSGERRTCGSTLLVAGETQGLRLACGAGYVPILKPS
ncbi:hypothetical protein Mpe_A1587 [Methylibium petroleiphilum PM1]|uniref:Uncharacterized protein n=1 Tax=Methylibium petroleiphilum (strain ATCC BAA-1232 / LMG 22953 / PM1) TaxID=420662 RepID=A2SG60_METPP|nr:hypothetical protein Mpe_A1587 [Methylibium petroleiphilum PM1]